MSKIEKITEEQKQKAIHTFMTEIGCLDSIALELSISRVMLQRLLRTKWLDKETYNKRKFERASARTSGENNSIFGTKRPQGVKDAVSKANRGARRSEEFKEKCRLRMLGHVKSEEALKKHVKNGSQYWKNKKFSESHKRALSLGQKGREVKPETLAKIVAFHTGKKRSKETRERLSIRATERVLRDGCPTKRTKKGVYQANSGKIERYDSSWELRRMQELDQLGLNWTKKHTVIISYLMPNEDNVRKYIPDFLVSDTKGNTWLEEVKGYETKKDLIKYEYAIAFCKEKAWGFKILNKNHFK